MLRSHDYKDVGFATEVQGVGVVAMMGMVEWAIKGDNIHYTRKQQWARKLRQCRRNLPTYCPTIFTI
jgi:hypothetical protein